MEEKKATASVAIFETDLYVVILIGDREPQYFDKESFDSVRFERRQDGSWRVRNFK